MSYLPILSILLLFLNLNAFSNLKGIEAEADFFKKDSRQDSYRLLHCDLFFDFKFKNLAEIRAEAKLDMHLLKAVQEIVLDIKTYDIYSVSIAGHASTFSFNDSNLIIQGSSTFPQGDTLQITVAYGGSTHTESAGFGGFFFKPPYAYNVGVAFNEMPHNYGRVWYPCLDFFTSRSTYTTRTLTYGNDISVSAGELTVDSIVAGDTVYREWEMRSAIPSYLHSLSVAPYEMIGWEHQGLQSSFPVELYSLAADTGKLRNSFVDLDSAIHYFEKSYHPFMWQKVGYSVLPMTGGAMEHACNIAYPRFAVNGNTDYETLMAHELAHSWWGNLVTCETASEMWLNEGWASFSEYLFLEKRYGWERAVEELQGVQYNVLKNAHQREGEYRAVANMKEPYIYGLHVYRKGSMVAWALRTYLGEDFEQTMNQFFADNQFMSINSSYLQSELERILGRSLSDFFDSWVFEPGFLDFFIKDMSFQNNSAQTSLSQLQTGTNKDYKGVPLELKYIYDDYSSEIATFKNVGATLNSSVSRKPTHVIVNPNNKLPLACTWDEKIIDQNGAVQLDRVDLELSIQGISDSAWIRVEQHWSEAPIEISNAANLKVRIAPNRHWRVYSLSNDTLSMNATLRYDGRAAAGLDPDLNGLNEDSLLLLYKPLYGGEWELHSSYSKNDLGSTQDAFGIFTISSLIDGNYAIGIRDKSASTNSIEEKLKIKLYPNPSLSNLRIESPFSGPQSLSVKDISGKLQFENEETNGQLELNIDSWKSGVYMIELSNGTRVLREKFVKN